MIDTGVELPEKLKSRDDDHAEHLRCGRDWHGMGMQKNGEYCMHKMHISIIYTVQSRERGAVVVGVVMVAVVVVEDSRVSKEVERRRRDAC
jgi:hypothetical protein